MLPENDDFEDDSPIHAASFIWRHGDDATELRLEEPVPMDLEGVELLLGFAYLHGCHELPDAIGVRRPDGEVVFLMDYFFSSEPGRSIEAGIDDLADSVEGCYHDLPIGAFSELELDEYYADPFTGHTENKKIEWSLSIEEHQQRLREAQDTNNVLSFMLEVRKILNKSGLPVG